MKRRTFVQIIPLAALAPMALRALSGKPASAKSQAAKATAGTDTRPLPDYAGKLQHSDGAITDADGTTQQGFYHSSSKPQQGPLYAASNPSDIDRTEDSP